MAYRRGQEVFREPKPFSYVVLPKYRKVVCDWCLKMCENEGILKACAKCNWVYYCDQTCQKEARRGQKWAYRRSPRHPEDRKR